MNISERAERAKNIMHSILQIVFDKTKESENLTVRRLKLLVSGKLYLSSQSASYYVDVCIEMGWIIVYKMYVSITPVGCEEIGKKYNELMQKISV